jgi:HlyD family secretion protein
LKTKWKVTLGVAGVAVLAGGGWWGYRYSQKDIVTVQTKRAFKQDLTALVTASGEIKPRNYINVGTNANAPSRITSIDVVEGQPVRKGQSLAKLENIQPEASLRAADENIRTAIAVVERTKAEVEKARVNFQRTEKLWNEKLIAKQEYDQRLLETKALEASVREAEARVGQYRAQRAQMAAALTSSQRRITQSQAQLRRAQDVLQRTYVVSPIDGIVTNLPVRVGETVVPGIQNSPASLIMTIADMSLITAEVKVDETDIVNVKLDQVADITIDAIPNKTFKGHVIEIGNTAILRSTGLAASQSAISSQEAKDFKVVIALDDPPSDIRPGLSATAKVVTAVRGNALSIPIQALTVRTKGDLEQQKKDGVQAAAPVDPAREKALREEIQGVFVIQGDKAVFRKVETGITGATDIEVLSGLRDGEEIVTGSYKVIRTMRNGAKIKIDNAPPKAES